ncbi:C-C chemokine receptor type 7 [Alosa sapidissima]|uniref:C-C chemokine receptor type 7 n=1 Tax=Alosa sapidissima TaxID=34773 RepID=UPI001C0965CD|nr:C-C chemokine receptor type 7 [Alosa sapidissima]
MDADAWVESFARAIMCLLGIVGNNWLMFRSLPGFKSQLKTNDVLLLNLAVSNLITNYMVDLPDTIADFARSWFLGLTYCRIFRFCADLSETSSIFSTLFISVFWNQKLVGSLKRGGAPIRLDNLRLVAALLGGSWTVAIVFSIPHLIFVSVDERDEEIDCVDDFPSPMAHQVYEILYLSLANAIPIGGIVFASIQIVATLLQNQRRIKGTGAGGAAVADKPQQGAPDSSGPGQAPEDSNAQPPPAPSTIYTGAHESPVQQQPRVVVAPKAPAKGGSSGSSGQVRAAKSVVAVASVFLVCWLTHLLLRITSNVKTSVVVVEVASYIAASYTSIIPYIFLYGVKKLTCTCR